MNTCSSRTSGSTIAYWTGAVALVALGSLALFSIGAPLLLTGVLMMVLSPWRKRPLILWPALLRPAFFSGLTRAVIGVALALRVMVSRWRGPSG